MNRQSKLIVTLGLALSTTLGSVACGPTPTPTPAPAPDNGLPTGPWIDPGCMNTGANYYKACCLAQTTSSEDCTTGGFLKIPSLGNRAFCNAMQAIYSGYSNNKTDGKTNERSKCCSGSLTYGGKTYALNGVTFTPDTDTQQGDCPDTLAVSQTQASKLSPPIKPTGTGVNKAYCTNYLSVKELDSLEGAFSALPSFLQTLLGLLVPKTLTAFDNGIDTNSACQNAAPVS